MTVARGIIVAAAASHAGKTTIATGLIAALRARGLAVAAAKCGPDYIDPKFLEAASGRPAINLDPWAMTPERLRARLARQAEGADVIVIEGVMGLFDGGVGGAGSTAALARVLGLPVVLVVGAQGMAQTAAAVAEGCARLAEGFQVAGALVNQIASDRHAALIAEGFERSSVPLLGLVRRDASVALASRHLGLVQAAEHADLTARIAAAGALVAAGCDVDGVIAAATAWPLPPPLRGRAGEGRRPQPPPPRMPHSYVEPEQRDGAKRLRKQQTPAERILWQELRAHRLGGLAFRRQVPIGSYIVDFACQDAKLVVEVDGESHREIAAYDRERDDRLRSKGYRTLRFSNDQVLSRPEEVLRTVREASARRPSPLPDPPPQGGRKGLPGLAPLGQRIAVARDVAFGFAYPHLLRDWREQGAEIAFFSPLADEAPGLDADAVFLPGGYPELYAGRIAAAAAFRAGMEAAARRDALIYGECGGYMVLGEGLTDAQGATHRMLALLPVATSFAAPKLQLGYRRLRPLGGSPWAEWCRRMSSISPRL